MKILYFCIFNNHNILKMKKATIVLSLVLITMSVFAQKKKKTENTEPNINSEVSIIKMAMKYGDVQTAISNIFAIIAKEGENSTYMDSLAYIYFNTGQFGQCNRVCSEILKNDETKANILEINAVSLKNLNEPIAAITAYEKLLPITNNIFHAYQLAQLQYSIKRLGEAFITIRNAEQLESTANDKISFPVGEKQYQNVDIKAAVYNLKGLIVYELNEKDTETAKQSFEKALEIQPDFVLAKNNLAVFSNMEKENTDNIPVEDKPAKEE